MDKIWEIMKKASQVLITLIPKILLISNYPLNTYIYYYSYIPLFLKA